MAKLNLETFALTLIGGGIAIMRAIDGQDARRALAQRGYPESVQDSVRVRTDERPAIVLAPTMKPDNRFPATPK